MNQFQVELSLLNKKKIFLEDPHLEFEWPVWMAAISNSGVIWTICSEIVAYAEFPKDMNSTKQSLFPEYTESRKVAKILILLIK